MRSCDAVAFGLPLNGRLSAMFAPPALSALSFTLPYFERRYSTGDFELRGRYAPSGLARLRGFCGLPVAWTRRSCVDASDFRDWPALAQFARLDQSSRRSTLADGESGARSRRSCGGLRVFA